MNLENRIQKIEEIAGRFESEAARLRREADKKERLAETWRRLLRLKNRPQSQESAVAA